MNIEQDFGFGIQASPLVNLEGKLTTGTGNAKIVAVVLFTPNSLEKAE